MLFVSKCTPLINSSVLFLIISQVSDFIQSFSTMYSSVPNNKGKGLNLKGATDKLNINKQGVHIKGVGSEDCSLSEVATRYPNYWDCFG